MKLNLTIQKTKELKLLGQYYSDFTDGELNKESVFTNAIHLLNNIDIIISILFNKWIAKSRIQDILFLDYFPEHLDSFILNSYEINAKKNTKNS